MAELGIDLGDALIGAQVNNMVNGRRQGTSLYDFGPGTYGPSGFWDSDAGQKAIKSGYLNSPRGKRNMKNYQQRKLRYQRRYERDPRFSPRIH